MDGPFPKLFDELVEKEDVPAQDQGPAQGKGPAQAALPKPRVDRSVRAQLSDSQVSDPQDLEKPNPSALLVVTVPPAPPPLLVIVPQLGSPLPFAFGTVRNLEPGSSLLKPMNPTIGDRVNPESVRTAAAVELPKLVDGSRVRLVAATAPEPGKIAFTARLTQMAESADTPPDTPADTPPDTKKPTPAEAEHKAERLILENAPALAPAGDPAPPAETSARSAVNPIASASEEPVKVTGVRQRREGASPQEQPAAAPPGTDLHPQSTVQSQTETAVAAERAAEQTEPAVRTQPEAPPEPPKNSTPAREIRLALTGGEQRVEVKLTDRGGEVQVAVRTADGHLATTLRENLPALTSRLAESGIRAQTCHPPASGGIEGPLTRESSNANAGDPSDAQPRQDRGQQDRGQQDRDGQPRRHGTFQETDQPKEKRKDFSWLMSTLR